MPNKDTIKNEILATASKLHKHRRQMLSMMDGFEHHTADFRALCAQAEDTFELDMEAIETYVRAGLKGFGADGILDVEELKGIFPSTRTVTKKTTKAKQAAEQTTIG